MPNDSHYRAIGLNFNGVLKSYHCGDSAIIEDLAQVNLLIGPNNSGKSRLLRELFSQRSLDYALVDHNPKTYLGLLESRVQTFERLFPSGCEAVGNAQKVDLANIINQCKTHDLLQDGDPTLKKILALASATKGMSDNPTARYTASGGYDLRRFVPSFKAFGEQLDQDFKKHKTAAPPTKRFYIPILRGMRPMDDNIEDFYATRTRNDYFKDRLGGDSVIFTGLSLYRTLKEHLLGEPEQREQVRNFENFLSDQFFKAAPLTLIPREGDNTVHVKIGGERQLPIYHLGDGLQNLIILTFNMYMEVEPCLFYFEEPDLSMHPGLQRALLQGMLSIKHHQYFLTTHSNHFLDMTFDFGDVSVYLLQKSTSEADPKYNISRVSDRTRNLLQELGVRNASVFLTECTIWIEGITDRLYLRAFLKKYIASLPAEEQAKFLFFKEDIHYSFVEYQGSNLVHWTFANEEEAGRKIKALRLCGKPLVIADGDVVGKGTRNQDYERELRDKWVTLRCKEIENLLPEEIVRHLLSKTGEENVSSIAYVEYSASKEGIGTYLDKKFGCEKYAAESGTIKNKVDFCEKAVAAMSDETITWVLNDRLKELCERIFQHVKECTQE